MESYSTQAVLSAVDKNFTSKMKSAVDSLNALDAGSKKVSTSIMDIAKGVGAFKLLAIAGNALKESLSGAIDRFDTMTRFPKVMENVGFSAESSNRSVQKLSGGIKGLPTSLDGITASTQRIAVLTGNLNKATDTSLALNNAFLASGAVTADAERGMTQYTQMLSKGTVDMQSWRTLQETMGYALSETAKQLGITSGNSLELYSAIQSGEITFDQMNDALIECSTRTGGFADKAKTASSGIKTSFGNLGIAVTRGMANTIQSVNDAMNKIDGSSIQGKIESTANAVDKFFEGTAKGAAVAVQAINLLGPSVATAAAGFVTFKTAMSVTNKIAELKNKMDAAKVTIDAFRNAQQLATQATLLSERATQRQQTAENLSAKAKEASIKAMNSELVATESSIAAKNARTAADKAATAEAKVQTAQEKLSAATTKLKTAEEKAAAAATKSKAVQEKKAASVTRAKANVDKTAAALETAKANAAKSGATASELSAKAETLDAAATKTKAAADKDSLGASVAKANAEKAETFASEASAAAEAKNAAAEEAGNIIKSKSSMLAIAKTAILAVLSGELGVVAAAQLAWNAAMTANPLGAAIIAVTAFSAVLVGVAKVLDSLDKETNQVAKQTEKLVETAKSHTEAVESSSKAYEDNISDIQASSKVNKELADNIANLSGKENKSAQDKAELKTYVDSLNSSMEGLNLQYDEETGKLNMSKDALLQKVAAYEQEAKAQAYRERYIEVAKEQAKVEEDLNNVTQRKKDLEEQYLEGMQGAPAAIGRYNEAAKGLSDTENNLNQKKKELAESENYLKGVMVESQAAQSAAVIEGANSQIITFESLSEAQQQAVQSMNETWQSYADQATNMFDVLSDKSELSVSEMTANMQENQRVIGAWADNIAILASRGVDEGLLEKLRQAGPESAGYVNAMVQASDTELQQMSEVFRTGGETATKALGAAIGSAEIPAEIMGFATKTKDTLAQQMAAADFGSIGKNVNSSIADSINSNTGEVRDAGIEIGEASKEGSESSLVIGSPSQIYMQYGQWTVQGYINGVQSQSGILNATMQSIMTSAGQAAVTAMNNALVNMNSISLVSFNQIPAAAKACMGSTAQAIASGMNMSSMAITSGMSASDRAVKTGMNNMQTSTNNGMKIMSNAVKNNLRDIQNAAVTGMSQFVRAIDNGMNQSRASVSRGGSAMLSAMSFLRSGFYNSGYNASMGLASGINSGAGAAIAAANRLANQVAATMRSALQVRSPSRVTRKIGGFTTEGFIMGMLDDIQKVKSVAVEVAQAATPTGRIANQVAYAGNFPSYESDYVSSVGATYTIIVPVQYEGREIARVTAPFTQEELDKRQKRDNRKRGIK